jgi:hypothetical protein
LSVIGKWDILYPLQVGEIKIAIEHAALLPTGKVLFIGEDPSSDKPYTLIWDPSNESNRDRAFQLLSSSDTGLTANMICCGHCFLSNGHLLAVGGGGLSPRDAISEAWKFDPDNLKWIKTASEMAYTRWYPTCVALQDKRVLVAGGSFVRDPQNRRIEHMEIYDETTDTFSLVTVYGPVREKVFPQLYPGLNLLPGGEIFYTPVGFRDCFQTITSGRHTEIEPSGYFKFTGANSGEWTNIGINVTAFPHTRTDIRTKAMQIILIQNTNPFVRIMVIGGEPNTDESKEAQIINLSTLSPDTPNPEWETPFQMNEARVHPNAVLLPDNTVFICGGLSTRESGPKGGPCELYNPADSKISDMAPLNYPRHYHSIALLLPNGKVLAAGGSVGRGTIDGRVDEGCTESLADNPIEVFSPSYLFKGPRPVITRTDPSAISLGSTFEIGISGDNIARIVLVRPMAVTHQTDTEQRVIPLLFDRPRGNTLLATAPDGKPPIGVVPRGYYMLFIIDDKGVPSEGRFILLH